MIEQLALSLALVTSTPTLQVDVSAPASSQMQHGVRDSVYTGKKFNRSQERWRKCIARRESNGRYWAINPTGSYRGAYQVSRALTIGMGWMIQQQLVAEGTSRQVASAIGTQLRSLPMNRWSRYWQDMGFYVTLNAHGMWSGKKHWAGGRYAC
jgi:hypothetical protein